MIGSFLTRVFVLILGYAYPAYECYKTVEKNKPEIEQLRFWCQYWILVAILTVSERIGDAFISWLPMYSEAKLAFFIYLWYPKTRGTTYVYESFFRPYVSKHENEIDRNLLELKARAGDIAVVYWQKASSYGQTRFFEVMQYLASQSTGPSRPVQQSSIQRRQPPPPTAAAAARQPPRPPSPSRQPQPPPITPRPSSSPAKKQTQDRTHEQTTLPPPPAPPAKPQPPPPPATAAKSEPSPLQATTTCEGNPTQAKDSSPANGDSNPTLQETVIEETLRVTRGRLRRTRGTSAASIRNSQM
ncbi:HVA22-like protein i [Acorus gramineus]|uniref:HVA22-like protein n=1 Tax=Acorus gramineus TaxID=55184 RepID=A0AAV9BC88_ACOGR|nr:HVA22-like protein i [Acorus gramineus]